MKYREFSCRNNESGLDISGVLTYPENKIKPPVVILVAGMGPNDRDYNIFGYKFFLELSNCLISKGIAVLRYDKRGVGRSEGVFDLTLTSQDLASDVLALIEYLKKQDDIDSERIGLLGHSEGGFISTMIAGRFSDIAFLVSMAGVPFFFSEDSLKYIADRLRVDGATEEEIKLDTYLRTQVIKILKKEKDYDIAEKKLKQLMETHLDGLPEALKGESGRFPFVIDKNSYKRTIKIFNSPWYRFFIDYNFIKDLAGVRVPMLAINGGCDFIVPSKLSLELTKKTLDRSGNLDYKIVEFPDLNHCFQVCEKGELEKGVPPEVLNLISQWIIEETN